MSGWWVRNRLATSVTIDINFSASAHQWASSQSINQSINQLYLVIDRASLNETKHHLVSQMVRWDERWDEMRWDEMRWDEMRWDEMRWDERGRSERASESCVFVLELHQSWLASHQQSFSHPSIHPSIHPSKPRKEGKKEWMNDWMTDWLSDCDSDSFNCH